MKKIISAFLILTTVILLASSCGMETKTIEPFLIKIDSLSAPDTVNIKYLFIVELFGIVGQDKCHAFEKAYQTTSDQNEIIIEAWGIYSNYGDPCIEGEVLMNEKFEMSVSKPGVYKLKGIQPNNNYFEKKLVVK